MLRYFSISILLITVVFISTAHGNDTLFSILDADENGYITLEETQDNIEVRKKFGILDINNDTQIDEQEFMLLNVDSSFKTLDQDQDLYVSYEEALVSSELEAQFILLDINNDQKLNPDEYANFSTQ